MPPFNLPPFACPARAAAAPAEQPRPAARPRLRIAILDDHPITAIGLAAYLGQCAEFDIVLIETSANRFLHGLAQRCCDVAIVDYDLPDAPCDGMSLIRRLRRHDSRMAIITLSADPARDTAYPAFRAGARGYLSKADPVHLIPKLIHAAMAQPSQFHLNIDGQIRPDTPQASATRLSAAETEILRHISLGLSVTQAAERLSRSKKTISTHKRSAMRKLGLADDLALALYLKERFESRLPG
ncbi:MAG TPA: response regulator transcription factor [Bordetella sp.]